MSRIVVCIVLLRTRRRPTRRVRVRSASRTRRASRASRVHCASPAAAAGAAAPAPDQQPQTAGAYAWWRLLRRRASGCAVAAPRLVLRRSRRVRHYPPCGRVAAECLTDIGSQCETLSQ